MRVARCPTLAVAIGMVSYVRLDVPPTTFGISYLLRRCKGSRFGTKQPLGMFKKKHVGGSLIFRYSVQKNMQKTLLKR